MWIDITQPMKNGMPNWPGDTPFSFEVGYTKQQTGSVNIGRMTTSLHTGTHADAPFHFNSEAETIEQLDVNVYIGDCVIVDCIGQEMVTAQSLEPVDFRSAKRVLLKTIEQPSAAFPQTIPVIHPNVAPFLKERGVILLGIDNPSVDPLDSKEVLAHHKLYEHGIHILEGLDLGHVQQGLYELIALPLKIAGADGAPVRAVVRKKLIE
ncbi:Kynurenine formamidase [Solibacillus isronensis B3W22]|uniref:Kynurenine formamidase n=1 Tax=Solibacillus isronensis B3W22 TaxID=1224748 RepID=K1KR94_9BACL|nr:arylformamidase [Solibacillus isronensis]AMO86001.1 arylformamidase [Solibacillus silvestris]EKB46675.1 Kynurenine formamidase [Solibacillus isronensis B3W22]